MTLDDNQKATHYIEMWKQTVTVQQHFNDIEWRIRGLALTAATFAVGAAAVAAKDGDWFVGPSVLLVGLLLWYAFYFVDRYWYHPLLKASVDQGHKLEEQLVTWLPDVDLTKTISAGSPIDRPRTVRIFSLPKNRSEKLHSVDKLVWFYRLGAIALAVSAVALGVVGAVSDSKPANDPVIVKFDPSTMPTPSSPALSPTTKPKPSKSPSPTASP